MSKLFSFLKSHKLSTIVVGDILPKVTQIIVGKEMACVDSLIDILSGVMIISILLKIDFPSTLRLLSCHVSYS